MALQHENNKSYFNTLKLAQIYNSFQNVYLKERVVENVLEKEGDINFKIPSNSFICSTESKLNGCTALHIAVMKNDLDITKILLKNGIDFTAKNQENLTALHCATYENAPSALIHAMLLNHLSLGDPTNPCDPDGLSHLHIACKSNQVDVVEFFLNSGVPVDTAVNSNAKKFAGYTPLHFAAEFMAVSVIRVLLKYQAKINVKDARGLTPRHLLLEEKIKALDVNKEKGEDMPVEMIDAIDSAINLLLDIDDVDDIGMTHFHIVCTQRDTSVAEFFMKQNVDVDKQVSKNSPIRPGYTALHFAAHCNLEIVIMLLRKQANYMAKDAKGKTPMDLIWEKYYHEDIRRIFQYNWKNLTFSDGRTSLLELIKSVGKRDKMFIYLANVSDITTKIDQAPVCWTGRTLLHFAVLLCRNTEFIDDCIKGGMNVLVDVQDSYGSTPIHLAFRMNKLDIVEILMKLSECDRNLADNDGLSYLHIACAIKNCVGVKRYCQDSNKDIFYYGRSTHGSVIRGSTALHVAMASGDSTIIGILKQCFLNMEAIDANGQTPLHRSFQFPDEAELYTKIHVLRNILYAELLTDQKLHDIIGVSRLHLGVYFNVFPIRHLINANNIEVVVKCEDSSSFMFPYDGYTPLHMAIKIGSRDEVVESLIDEGANLLAKNHQGDTPLYLALTKNPNCKPVAKIMTTLRHNDELRYQLEEISGITLLHIACYMVNRDAVNWLLIGGFDVNAKVKSDCHIWAGCTPLHLLMKASEYNITDEYASRLVNDDFYSILVMILKAGADVTSLNENNETAIHLSLREFSKQDVKVYKVANELLKNLRVFNDNPADQNGMSHFHAACLVNNVEVVKSFIDNGVDINQPIDFFAKDFPGETPLHLAVDHTTDMFSASECKLETIHLLLNSGADLKAENSFGQTVLHKAVKSTVGFDTLERFVELGAAVNSKDMYGRTPLETLLHSENVSAEKIKLFEKYGCRLNDSNSLTEQGFISILISQCYPSDCKRYTKLVPRLVIRQCFNLMVNAVNSSTPDDMGRYLIHNIVTRNSENWEEISHDYLIEQLKSVRFYVDLPDKRGKTALHLAAQFGNLHAVTVLLDSGADINILDGSNKTALNYAMEYYYSGKYCCSQQNQRNVIKCLVNHAEKLSILSLEINRNNMIAKEQAYRHKDKLCSYKYQGNGDVRRLYRDSEDVIVADKPNLYLRDFLSETGKGLISYSFTSDARRKIIDKFFRHRKGYCKAVYSLQYRKAVKRKTLIKGAMNSFSKVAGWTPPIICLDMIFQYLFNSHLENLIKASSTVDHDLIIVE